jgi:DNA topoisomerase-2
MTKKIEEKYQQLSEVEHVLLRPGMWVGSIKDEERSCFVYDIDEEKMIIKDIIYSPAMLKLFDEVLSNSCDEYRRKDNMGLNKIIIKINKETQEISVIDNGGIPIVKHKEAKMYVPEFIFGQLRTSSNYDDTEDRNVIGTNGVGSSLTNIFSKKFTVISCDKKNQITVTWTDNMSKKSTPIINKSKEHFTNISFILDFNRFDQKEKGLTNEFIDILHKRCIDAAAANPGLKIIFECEDLKTEWKFNRFEDYMELYSDYYDKNTIISYKDNKKQFWICPDSSIDVAFVNGAECSKGTHIKAVRYPVGHVICEQLKKKYKIDVTNKAVDSKYGIFGIFDISNPSYNSQTKEELNTPQENFYKDGSEFNIPDNFLKKCQTSEIIELVVDWYKKKLEAEDSKTLRKLNRDASKGLKRSNKYIPCNSKKKIERQIWIYEGDSAARGFRTARDPQIQAAYTMRGVPPNCLDMSPLQIMKNDVFNDLVSVIGLKFGNDFDINDINFGKIVICTDADVDGDRICALLLLFFSMNWPELIEKNIVCRCISPIIVANKGKDSKKFYTMEDFNKEVSKLKSWEVKYCKGLSGLNAKETKEMMREPIFHYFTKDNQAEHFFKKWFGKDADTRKDLMIGV